MTDLPPDFRARARSLEAAYLESDDPIRQSGFGGGPERWRAERQPILDAVEGDGDLLDIGCANGYLLECLVAWGAERGLALTPLRPRHRAATHRRGEAAPARLRGQLLGGKRLGLAPTAPFPLRL